MNSQKPPVTIKSIKATHAARRTEILKRLSEFEDIWNNADDERLWEEMVFCFFTGGCSAKMGLRSIGAVKRLLKNGTHDELTQALLGVHRYPNARSRYIVESRDFLTKHCQMHLGTKLKSFECELERRDWLVKEKGIKGLGYKEASHFLRNIGLKGYGILDKHVLQCMFELRLITDAKPPNNRLKYLRCELSLKSFAKSLEIDFDEMDLVLWSMKTGEILK